MMTLYGAIAVPANSTYIIAIVIIVMIIIVAVALEAVTIITRLNNKQVKLRIYVLKRNIKRQNTEHLMQTTVPSLVLCARRDSTGSECFLLYNQSPFGSRMTNRELRE